MLDGVSLSLQTTSFAVSWHMDFRTACEEVGSTASCSLIREMGRRQLLQEVGDCEVSLPERNLCLRVSHRAPGEAGFQCPFKKTEPV